jgi:predicted transcriptional regulator
MDELVEQCLIFDEKGLYKLTCRGENFLKMFADYQEHRKKVQEDLKKLDEYETILKSYLSH